MFSYVLCFSSYILISFKYCVAEEADVNKRFIVEEDFKPAIFGSNKFNPILQIFEDVNEVQAATTSNNETGSQVTAIGEVGPETTTPAVTADNRALFRQHLTLSTVQTTMWWARSRSRPNNNATRPVLKPRTL